MSGAGWRDDADVALVRGPLRLYDVLTKRIHRYTKRLDRRWYNRNRTEARLRKAERGRSQIMGFIAVGLGTEKAASLLGLSKDVVESARQELEQGMLERSLPDIDEFMRRPEIQERLRRRDTLLGRPETPIYEKNTRLEWSESRQAWEEVTREFEHGQQIAEVHRDMRTGEVTFEKHGDFDDQPDDDPGGPSRP